MTSWALPEKDQLPGLDAVGCPEASTAAGSQSRSRGARVLTHSQGQPPPSVRWPVGQILGPQTEICTPAVQHCLLRGALGFAFFSFSLVGWGRRLRTFHPLQPHPHAPGRSHCPHHQGCYTVVVFLLRVPLRCRLWPARSELPPNCGCLMKGPREQAERSLEPAELGR